MAAKPVAESELQKLVDLVKRLGTISEAAAELGLSSQTATSRMRMAGLRNIIANKNIPDRVSSLKQEVKALTSKLLAAEKEQLSNQYVRKVIFDL